MVKLAGRLARMIRHIRELSMSFLEAPASRRPVGSRKLELVGETPALPGNAPCAIRRERRWLPTVQ
jgi:hypothetical protein